MIGRLRRFKDLLESRHQSYSELLASRNVEETLSWGRRNRLLGFNRSALRFRILYSLASAFQTTHFIETGTYHGATSVAAFRGLKSEVWTCEFSLSNYWAARAITFGLGIRAVHADSPVFMQNVVTHLANSKNIAPLFYLDAHAGINEDSCPILEEVSRVLQLESFLVVIDDFQVPGSNFDFRTYGTVRLELDLIRCPLSRAGIRRVFFPAYAPELEMGIARTGYAIFFRSPILDRHVETKVFPLDLLQSRDVTEDARIRRPCASF